MSTDAKHRAFHDKLAETTADELDAMIERLDELEDWAVDQGYRALETKVSEARGPLSSAAEAMRQYATGELQARTQRDDEKEHLDDFRKLARPFQQQHLIYAHQLTAGEVRGKDDNRDMDEMHRKQHE